MSRIHRFLLAEGFISRWNITTQWIGDRDISDHCPIWLVSSNLDWGPKLFKFNNCWFQHKDFMSFAQDCWASFSVEGRTYHEIKGKLKMMKEKQKWGNSKVFGFKDLHIDNLVKEMNEVKKVAAEGGSPKVEKRKALSVEFWQEIRIKESLLA